jgi:hypothetical protein
MLDIDDSGTCSRQPCRRCVLDALRVVSSVYEVVAAAVVAIEVRMTRARGGRLRIPVHAGRADSDHPHVVQRAKQVIVHTAAGQAIDADLIGDDPHTDVALLKVASARPCRASSSDRRAHSRRPARRRDRQSARLCLDCDRRCHQRAWPRPASTTADYGRRDPD